MTTFSVAPTPRSFPDTTADRVDNLSYSAHRATIFLAYLPPGKTAKGVLTDETSMVVSCLRIVPIRATK